MYRLRGTIMIVSVLAFALSQTEVPVKARERSEIATEDKWKLEDRHSEKEDKKRFDNVPDKCDGSAKINLGQLVYSKGCFVNDV